jgi:hypothetical protein
MEEARIQHGQEVRVDLPNVRVAATAAGRNEVFFCNMGPIRVKQVFAAGDAQPLPANVLLDGLDFPAAGSFDIVDALISSNGDIRIYADGRTKVQARPRLIDQAFAGSLFEPA